MDGRAWRGKSIFADRVTPLGEDGRQSDRGGEDMVEGVVLRAKDLSNMKSIQKFDIPVERFEEY